MQFLTVVGITDDELAAMQATSTDVVLAGLRSARYAMLETDTAR